MGNFKKLICLLTVLLSCTAFNAEAKNTYPAKPITLVVPFSAGGDTDLTARVWAEFAKKELGQPVLVVNKVGGGGLTGTVFAANAKPDGYTILLASPASCVMSPLLSKAGGLNKNSFDYASQFYISNGGVVVRGDAPWKNLKDFHQDAAKNPNKYIFSSQGATALVALSFRSWTAQNNLQLKNVEYSGGGEAATALLGKHADISMLFPPNFLSLVKSGDFKLLALGTKSDAFPNVQTFAEQGYEGVYYAWGGICTPKGAPQDVLDRLIEVTEKISKDPAFLEALGNLGFIPTVKSGKTWQAEVEAQYVDMEVLLGDLGFLAK